MKTLSVGDVFLRYAHRVANSLTHVGARRYCEWVRREANVNVRLPTVAEWEFAASGGDVVPSKVVGVAAAATASTTCPRFSFGHKFDKTKCAATLFPEYHTERQPVMSYPANSFGLYDVCGTVCEWTCDLYKVREFIAVSVPSMLGTSLRQLIPIVVAVLILLRNS